MEYFDFPPPSSAASSAQQAGFRSETMPPADSVKQESQENTVKTPVGTPLDPPNLITVSTAFHPSLTLDGALPDLDLVSGDGVHFYVHRTRLSSVSANQLGGLLHVDTTRQVEAMSSPLPIRTQPSAEVLNVVLHMIYGLSCMHYYPTLEAVSAALDVLKEYGVPIQVVATPNQPLYQLLLSFAPFRPIDAYSLAAYHSLEDAAVSISSHLLAYDLGGLPDTAAEKMGPIYLKRLFTLHQTRIAALRDILFTPPVQHPPTPICMSESQQTLTRAWALAAAQLVWNVLPSMSTMALRSLLEPIALKLECQLCAAALNNRVQEVVYEWSSVKVASKYMPNNSVIVGVDLVPIKPIPRVVTFAADITTTHCRNLIRNELKDWKADVVLHDGAPNVGTAWVQDAYSQSELVLMSMKLAAEFLIKGGTFVTKVFRSADYNNLIWVFNQLFGKVEATKPPSSRNVSAEIFVVCRDFLAPKHIDPKFFDPRHVFKDLSATMPADEKSAAMAKNAQMSVFQPEKKRRQRSGYDDGDYTLYKEAGAADFIRCQDAVTFLGTFNKITFKTDEEKEWLNMDITTADVKANCEDLKVLGKGDFKTLIKWRTALREELGLEVKTKPTEELTETVEVTEEVDEETQIQQELERLNAEAAARAKRERRRANEIKARTIQRMQLRMTAPMDIGLEQHDAALGGQDDMFELDDARALRGKREAAGYDDESEDDAEEDGAHEEDEEEVLDSEEERERKVAELEAELDGLYDAYQEHLKARDAKWKVKEARKNSKAREEWSGIGKGGNSDGSDNEAGGWDRIQRAKARVGEGSSDDDSSDDESDEEEAPASSKKRRRADGPSESGSKSKKARTVAKLDEPASSAPLSRAAQLWFNQDLFAGADAEIEDEEEEDESEGEDEDADEAMSQYEGEPSTSSKEESDSDDFEIVPQDRSDDDADMWDAEGENEDELKQAKIQKHGLTTAEAMSLATALVNREKTKTELINEGFNRYALNAKDGLPSWFLDDESKHYKTNIPITKEAVAAIRAKMRALDARPIKKVAEAKARKKLKAAQRLEKAMKKAEGVNETSDLTEREKAKQIEKLMAKGMKAKQKKDIKVVVAKGAHKGLKGRPKGVKGRYVMVDSRMKKELRAKKRKEKANKKRKRT
ncbi:hypothetical protein BN946_scf184726.g2 [Trametes cinnabarina]|uniref:Uncharacterized protein n=1 Tax=Pycnoporus cinnabarinus TaxID=5643 RepID=A0A060SUK7_PYCCI|nr:hypothetical protein BN946_scf184726.g2 [Trametes cinnabarina]